jgi:hypothetical protein
MARRPTQGCTVMLGLPVKTSARLLDLLVWASLAVICVGAAAFVSARQTAVDYPVYLAAAYGFLQGADIYAWQEADYDRVAAELGLSRYATPYRYPPLTALLVAPLVNLPREGLWVWSGLQAGAWLLTVALLGRQAAGGSRRRVGWLMVGSLVPFFVSLYAGQVNPLTTLLVAAAVLTLARGRSVTPPC